MSQAPSNRPNPQDTHLNRARASLRQAFTNYSQFLRSSKNPSIESALKSELETISSNLKKLDQYILRIAVFGLVSRGKSAILNALIGEKVFETGPLNGVTQAPSLVTWTPSGGLVSESRSIIPESSSKIRIELIDTPGLDEIDGQARADMAKEVAQQADLILFVISGDITRTEYKALCDLRQAQKPLILVFNKVDLYPDQSRQEIYRNLQNLGARTGNGADLEQLLTAEEIVMVAAEPAPFQVRVEYPDGRISYEWETPPPQIEELKAKILTILNREGRSLLALNALTQARTAELEMATKVMELRDAEAEELIWKFTRYKAIAIALNPIAFLDLIGGAVSDLAMIQALANLYGLPMTRYEAGKLLNTILLSSGSLLLGELGSGIVLGMGKSAAALATGVDGSAGFSALAGTAIVQAGIAGYGSYSVGRAAQVYLENGCTWGAQGANTVIREILDQVDAKTIIYRLKQELL
ncbi:GTP-binding protein [Leptolyngbya sp. AN03gr2]|uniref:GTP-binding protein n=1 Tax=unclassified Leptolyngbya TaxID=2650499 RepID=UPI003D3135FD